MRLFTTTDFTGHWPVGTSAVIVADSNVHAVELMQEALKAQGLDHRQSFTMQEIDPTVAQAHILQDGNY